MSAIEIRPRFRMELPLPPGEIIGQLKQAINQPTAKIVGFIADHHVVLKIPQEQRHYWSPQLSLEVEDNEKGGSLIRGLYGPAPSVWLMFLFFYYVIGAICLFTGIMGFAQVSLGMPAPILWVLPMGAILAVGLFLSAKAGERLGRDQMLELKIFLEEVLESASTQ
ncbi:MAG TPA: hypothetical protein PKA00_06330 [Saprospiraceae bacterium]|nr:hypothetical protein [Saprospiraceae bacterium]HMQ82502.1 hypothetical protein [Saprospiraceae bacterium]